MFLYLLSILFQLLLLYVMPKPIISCGTVLVNENAELNGKLVGHLYIDYNKALSLHIYPDSVGQTGFGSFSYPVAE